MKVNKLTVYMKNMRVQNRYSLREAAKEMSVSAPFLHDVEAGERNVTRKVANEFIRLYHLDDEGKRTLFDAIAEATDSLPYDVVDFLKSNPEALQTVIGMMNNQKQKKH